MVCINSNGVFPLCMLVYCVYWLPFMQSEPANDSDIFLDFNICSIHNYDPIHEFAIYY